CPLRGDQPELPSPLGGEGKVRKPTGRNPRAWLSPRGEGSKQSHCTVLLILKTGSSSPATTIRVTLAITSSIIGSNRRTNSSSCRVVRFSRLSAIVTSTDSRLLLSSPTDTISTMSRGKYGQALNGAASLLPSVTFWAAWSMAAVSTRLPIESLAI